MKVLVNQNGKLLSLNGQAYKLTNGQEKTIVPTTSIQTVTADTGKILECVNINRVDNYDGRYDDLSLPLCFMANTAGSTIALEKTGSPAWTGSYSTDGTTWTAYTPGTTGAITLANAGDKVYFKGDITGDFSWDNCLQFSMTGSIAASGNCNSMYTSTNFAGLVALTSALCYCKMFLGCTSLTTAPSLPATTLTNDCYSYMFYGCTSLTIAPSLPATTLASYCYSHMFNGCTSLTSAPALSATTLASNCYYYMFSDCTSLYVSDAPVSGTCDKVWSIPSSGVFLGSSSSQNAMFYNCLGTRSSYNMPGVAGQSYTYYTQNTPV